jgi:hypothetical protein
LNIGCRGLEMMGEKLLPDARDSIPVRNDAAGHWWRRAGRCEVRKGDDVLRQALRAPASADIAAANISHHHLVLQAMHKLSAQTKAARKEEEERRRKKKKEKRKINRKETRKEIEKIRWVLREGERR